VERSSSLSDESIQFTTHFSRLENIYGVMRISKDSSRVSNRERESFPTFRRVSCTYPHFHQKLDRFSRIFNLQHTKESQQ
jgi:hypothetical protein